MHWLRCSGCICAAVCDLTWGDCPGLTLLGSTRAVCLWFACATGTRQCCWVQRPGHTIYLEVSRQVWGCVVGHCLLSLWSRPASRPRHTQTQHRKSHARTIKCNWKDWNDLAKVKEMSGEVPWPDIHVKWDTLQGFTTHTVSDTSAKGVMCRSRDRVTDRRTVVTWLPFSQHMPHTLCSQLLCGSLLSCFSGTSCPSAAAQQQHVWPLLFK